MSHPLPDPDGSLASTNSRLAAFLQASCEAESQRLLADLVESAAVPVMLRVLNRKFGHGVSHDAEIEDALGEAREQLIARLLALRVQAQAPPASDAVGQMPPIRDFRDYCAALAYAAWSKYLSRIYPARALLANQLRHLVEDRRGLRGFACWQSGTGERWCGFARWKPAASTGPTGSCRAAAPRLRRLVDEPHAVAREALAGRADPETCALPRLLEAIFTWADAPLEWHDLSNAVVRLRGADHPAEIAGETVAEAVGRVADPQPDPHDQARWREYLVWLWRAAGSLPLRQRTAYLLHTQTVFEWESAGIATIRDLAAAVGQPPWRLAEFWSRLPLDDLTIAQLLAVTRQQVINLRRVARDTLGRNWQRWIGEGHDPSSPENPRRQVISASFPTRS